MLRQLEHKFVKSVPRALEPGVLYVSLEYATIVHSCCCGCGEEVVTPLSPTDWKMTFDGASISLSPSIGNWNLKCRSHYFVRQGKVVKAGSWSQERIDSEWQRDKRAKAKFYNTTFAPIKDIDQSAPKSSHHLNAEPSSVRLLRWLTSIFK